MNHFADHTHLTRRTLLLYWGGILLPLLIPPAALLVADPGSVKWLAKLLFAPGANLFMLMLLALLPFLPLAPFTLFHVGLALRRDSALARRRMAGCAAALLLALAASLWGHLTIALSDGSTAAIGYIFLPAAVFAVLVGGYPLGRLILRLFSSPAEGGNVPK